MAVFRIEKIQNYTIMSNHHSRNKSLPLKAKEFLTQTFSQSEKWSYLPNGTGKMPNNKYKIYEQLLEADMVEAKNKLFSPPCGFPATDNPISVLPLSDSLTSANTTQLNKGKAFKEKSITDLSSINSLVAQDITISLLYRRGGSYA